MISVSTLFAQEKEKKRNIFGVIIGGTFSDVTNYGGNTRQGMTTGVYWEWEFAKKFSIMSNILYSQRGELAKTNLPDIKLAYLNLPFSIKYSISDKFGVSAGINWDLLISVDGKGIDKDSFRKSDWGIPIGVSYDITNNLKLGAIYVYGLTDITKNDNVKMKNNWGSISIAYLFK